VCTVCDLPVEREQVEFEIQFGLDGSVETYHVHIRCFAAWGVRAQGGWPLAMSRRWPRLCGAACLADLTRRRSLAPDSPARARPISFGFGTSLRNAPASSVPAVVVVPDTVDRQSLYISIGRPHSTHFFALSTRSPPTFTANTRHRA
jgi:hypothetical protein